MIGWYMHNQSSIPIPFCGQKEQKQIQRTVEMLILLYEQLTQLEDPGYSDDDEMASEEEVNEDDSDSYESD